MICPKCNGTIPDNSKFCTLCGAKIEPQMSAQPAFNLQAKAQSVYPAAGFSSQTALSAGEFKGELPKNKTIASMRLSVNGCIRMALICWVIELICCFVPLLGDDYVQLSLKQLADMLLDYADVNLHFWLIVTLIVVLIGMGAFLFMNPASKDAVKVMTVFGIGSLVADLYLLLFYVLIAMVTSEGSVTLTVMGILGILSAVLLLVSSVRELELLCSRPVSI